MSDTIIVITAIYPDGTSERRTARIASDSSAQLRINFHEGRIGRGSLVKPIRLSAAASSRPGQKPGPEMEAAAAASPSTQHQEGRS